MSELAARVPVATYLHGGGGAGCDCQLDGEEGGGGLVQLLTGQPLHHGFGGAVRGPVGTEEASSSSWGARSARRARSCLGLEPGRGK